MEAAGSEEVVEEVESSSPIIRMCAPRHHQCGSVNRLNVSILESLIEPNINYTEGALYGLKFAESYMIYK